VRRHLRRPHPQLHLPPLNGHEALLLVTICERLIAAVWRAHGEVMGDILIEPLANRLPPQPWPHSSITPTVPGSTTGDDDDIF
jgi:hypothetical protein